MKSITLLALPDENAGKSGLTFDKLCVDARMFSSRFLSPLISSSLHIVCLAIYSSKNHAAPLLIVLQQFEAFLNVQRTFINGVLHSGGLYTDAMVMECIPSTQKTRQHQLSLSSDHVFWSKDRFFHFSRHTLSLFHVLHLRSTSEMVNSSLELVLWVSCKATIPGWVSYKYLFHPTILYMQKSEAFSCRKFTVKAKDAFSAWSVFFL